MVTQIVLFCKSYRDDVQRALRLAESVAQFNVESLSFYMSVPQADLAFFREKFASLPTEFVTDEEIVAANPRFDRSTFAQLLGRVGQQIVKAEFWRLGHSESYVCLDSDCYFLKPFRSADFLAPDGTPYTVMHESKDLLNFAERARLPKIARYRTQKCEDIMSQFGRLGRHWDFGPIPAVWSSKVWRDLDERFFQSKNTSIVNAVKDHPGELNWYGEALLAYRSIPLFPIEPLFRCYHYEEEYLFWQDAGETDAIVAANYLGICRQSNWDKSLDLVKKFKFSRLRRRIRRSFSL